MRKEIIDNVGGLQRFGCYLAEDFFIAKAIQDAGWKMTISSQPGWQNSGVCDLASFQARLTRWAKLRLAMVPTTIILEPLSECMVIGGFASWAVSVLFHWDSLVFYLIHILVWFLSDWVLLSIVQVSDPPSLNLKIDSYLCIYFNFQNGSLPFNKFDFVVGWLFREFSGPYLFFHAIWNPAIRWRTRVYKLAWGGIAYELSQKIKT
jgi:ceramide glucosyltransferase